MRGAGVYGVGWGGSEEGEAVGSGRHIKAPVGIGRAVVSVGGRGGRWALWASGRWGESLGTGTGMRRGRSGNWRALGVGGRPETVGD